MIDLSALAACPFWKLHGHGPRAAVMIWGVDRAHHQITRVQARRRRGETLDALVMRAVTAFHQRQRDGMPRVRPDVVARRALRAAVSPSRFSH